jgi:hypothetical protein
MQVPLLDQPEPWAGPFIEPLTEPFVGQYEERPHEPTESDTVDAMSATNDRAEVQDAMDDGTEAKGVMRLRTEEVGVTIGRPSLRTSLAQGEGEMKEGKGLAARLNAINREGKDEDEYIAILRLVFQRFREKKITINPDKCIFGADEVEFMGHVLDAEGSTFSKTKFDSVVEFVKPSNMKELRSFVELVNYFRDHIQNPSIITQPLQMMITEGARTRMVRVPGKKPMQHIIWTPEAEVSFAEIKQKINACPKLFFMDGKLPISFIRMPRIMPSEPICSK